MNEANPDSYSWQVRLFARDPRKLYGVLFACAFGALAGWLIFHNIGFALVGFIAIGGSTAEFWMPQQYKLDRNGATARCGISVTAINWNDVKQVIPDERGVKLSPLTGSGRMNEFRGVYLRFGNNREQVLERIEQHFNTATLQH